MSSGKFPSLVIAPILGLLFATNCVLEDLSPPPLDAGGGTSVGAAGTATSTVTIGSGQGGSGGTSTGTSAGTAGTFGTGGSGGGGTAGSSGAGGSNLVTDAGGNGGMGGRPADGGSGDGSVRTDGGTVQFSAVRMLLTSNCSISGCHGNNGGQVQIDLRDTTGLYTRLTGMAPTTAPTACQNHPLISPSMPTQSFLISMVDTNATARMNCGGRMPDGCPNSRPCLTTAQIQMLKDWVTAGAPAQ